MVRPFTRMKLLLAVIGVFVGLCVGAQDTVMFQGKNGPGTGKHIVLLAGDEEYRSEEAMPLMAKILAERHGFKCTVLFSLKDGEIAPTNTSSLSGPEALD